MHCLKSSWRFCFLLSAIVVCKFFITLNSFYSDWFERMYRCGVLLFYITFTNAFTGEIVSYIEKYALKL